MTLAIAIPAPAVAADASPIVIAVTLLVAVTDRNPTAAIELKPEILEIAELLIVETATAASTDVSI